MPAGLDGLVSGEVFCMRLLSTRVLRVIVVGAAALVAGLLTPVGIDANHQWGSYRWPNSGTGITLTIRDNVDGDWDGHLTAAAQDWDDLGRQNGWPDALTLTIQDANGSGSDCEPTSLQVVVCNGSYGSTGWLGIAQIWVQGTQDIVQATTRLNDFYFRDDPSYAAYYGTDQWRQFVMCQEVGHDFGLDHQDENFYNPNLGSCMDYTANPADNQHPNQHDFEQLGSMYISSGSTGGGGKTKKPGGGGGGGGGGRGKGQAGEFPDGVPDVAQVRVPMDSPGQWGQLVRSNGRVALYDLDLGFGNHIFTFVVWAL
jgi:hypothetical protein